MLPHASFSLLRQVLLIAMPTSSGGAGFSKSGMGKAPHSAREAFRLNCRAVKENKISQAGEPAGAPLQGQTSPPRRILVADDDPHICRLNTEVLIRHGYEVNAVADGAAAWEALNTDRYNLLITDHDMPKMSGVELLRKLRATRMALPVIMATGTLPTQEFARYPWLQPTATLLKPYTIVELLGTVKEVLRATDGAREQIAPPPDWQSRPSAEGWQLR